MTLYWGTSDEYKCGRLENSTNWNSVCNQFLGVSNFWVRGKFGSVEDLKSLNHDGSAILMGELTDPVTNGMYFNQ